MSLYRCASCGSSKVVIEYRQQGYQKLSRKIISVLFEHGIWKNLNVVTKSYYYCKMCGKVLDYSMSNAEKEAIDRYLKNTDVYETALRDYKKRYKNIEWE